MPIIISTKISELTIVYCYFSKFSYPRYWASYRMWTGCWHVRGFFPETLVSVIVSIEHHLLITVSRFDRILNMQRQDCFLPKGSYAYPSSVLFFAKQTKCLNKRVEKSLLIGYFMGRETVYCNLNSNMVEGVGCLVLAARQRHVPWNSLPMSWLFGSSTKVVR